MLNPSDQQRAIDILRTFRADIEAKGDDISYLRDLGALKEDEEDDEGQLKARIYDTCNWRLSMMLRAGLLISLT